MKMKVELCQRQVDDALAAADEASAQAEEQVSSKRSRLELAERDRDEFTDRLVGIF